MGLIVFDIEEKPIDDRPSFIGLTYDGGLINIQASNNCIEWRLMNRGDVRYGYKLMIILYQFTVTYLQRKYDGICSIIPN